MPKFHEYVKELKEKYSVRDAAQTLKMHYSHLYSLLTSKRKPHGRAMSHGAKKNVVKLLPKQQNITTASVQKVRKSPFLAHLISCCI